MNISNLSMGSHRYTTNVFTVVTKITSGDPIITTCINHSLGQLTSHHWPSFGKGENKGSVLLWYSCFDRSIFDVSDAWRITKSNQYIETLSDEAVNRCQSTDLFPPLPKLGQLASIDRENENPWLFPWDFPVGWRKTGKFPWVIFVKEKLGLFSITGLHYITALDLQEIWRLRVDLLFYGS